MKTLIFLVCLFAHLSLMSVPDLKNIRSMFYSAANDRKKADELIASLNASPDRNSPVIRAYLGMGYMLLAKHSFNPINKLSNFFKGKELLEKAIVEGKVNVELRFLRFSVQLNAPSFLNYSANLTEDKILIASQFKFIKDVDPQKRIKDFFVESGMVIQ